MKLDNTMAAIVTGGASGLGEGTARMLAGHGVKVTLFDLNEERGEAIARDIGGLFVKVDVTDDASLEAGFARARAAHGIERVLVNCAGVAPGKRTVSKKRETGELVPHDMASFAKTVQINLVGTFAASARAAAGMAVLNPITEDGGRGVIVMTASVAAQDGQIGQAAYAASKAGVVGLTLPMARDLSTSGIRVMTILPGLFHTPMFESITEEYRKALEANVPFPSRLGKPEEYAKLVGAFIDNDMLNGEIVRLDGALRMQPK
ncbi:SDR family NAD(P)-dependent oxidoreductase [Saliniramus sp.]|uniref:SDR family NAD(P)-dependent oxidoreductase n=1 Tax=Saliniramus sp. TaxID=2986772 RepID=UPI002BD963E0|nr:SDR family NAD(P)-dependent oxidoreductase [Saliniramus sp.]HMB10676.1 SDR family NAD(P)-dependent oxidoreductase [Saliniramus sp.]